MTITVRQMKLEDAVAAADLSTELGYPVPADTLRQRIEALNQFPDHVIYVACACAEVAGWIHVSEIHHLQAEPRAEIGGLVVSDRLRSRGIGRRLVSSAENWARERGLKSIVVRSQIAREGAHRFYEREGYARTKTSAVFTKQFS